MKKSNTKNNVVFLTSTAVLMAMNIALSSFGIPVPGGHLYLNDIVIVLAAILLNPFGAFMVGGVGAFLGDFFFYPAPMFVSLVTHGIQAVVISIIVHKAPKDKKFLFSVIGTIVGGIIMVIGYTLGRAFVYATPEVSMAKLPYEILQAGLGIVFGLVLCYPCRLGKIYNNMFPEKLSA